MNALPNDRNGLPRPKIRPHPALPAGVAGALILLALLLPLLQGEEFYASLNRGYPGVFTAVATSVLRTVAWLGAVATLAQLGLLCFFGGPAYAAGDSGRAAARRAAGFAVVWGLSSLLLIGFIAADNNGVPLNWVVSSSFMVFLDTTQAAQAWVFAALCAAVIVPALLLWQTWVSRFVSLVLLCSAVLLTVLVGQVSVGADHDFASDAAGFAVPAALLWLSSLLGVYWFLAAGGKLSAQGFRRFHVMSWICAGVALVGYAAVAYQGLAGNAPTDSSYGTIFLVALLAAAGSALLAWSNARQFNRAMAEQAKVPAGYRWRLTALLGLGAVFLGALLALQRTIPPRYLLVQTTQENFLGFSIDGARSFIGWLLPGRTNVLFSSIAIIAVLLYLLGVRTLRNRGDVWSKGRTISWLLGWLAVYYFTSSVWAERSPGSFGLHMMGHMGLNMLAPVLLVLGGPVTLALRALRPAKPGALSGPREWINALMHSKISLFLTNPLLVFAIFVGSYYALYFSPLFELGMRYHWAHQAMNLHFIISGYLFYWIVIGIDRAPRPMPYIGKLGFTLAAMPFHAFFAVAVMSSTTIIGENFYRSLQPDWNTDFKADQYLGGGVAWAAGELPLIVVVIALLTQWSRSDQREAKRKDRRGDQGLDDSLDNYNDMLAALSDRNRPQSEQPNRDAARQGEQ
ncbi:MAG: cytochrome c oxidase assembly protein [Renibacterium salmoninarum]|nr:cytochrome c oxidase assembly protein [Renibacterium salmoninarum]